MQSKGHYPRRKLLHCVTNDEPFKCGGVRVKVRVTNSQLATLHDEDEMSLFFLFLGDLNYDVKYICGCRERKNRASVLVKRNRYKSPYFFFLLILNNVNFCVVN